MPTRRQVLHGIGVLTVGGLAANGPLIRELRPHTRKIMPSARQTAAGQPSCGVNKGTAGMWQAVSAATGGLAGFRGYDTPAEGSPASWPGPGASPVPASASLQVISI